jgi:hypothetical protein
VDIERAVENQDRVLAKLIAVAGMVMPGCGVVMVIKSPVGAALGANEELGPATSNTLRSETGLASAKFVDSDGADLAAVG